MENTSTAALSNGQEQILEIDKFRRGFTSGADWFYWIAGLSIVNSVIMLFQGEWSFIVGLGITQIVDGIALAFGGETGGVQIVALFIDVVIAFVFAMFGWLARKKMAWAFIVGMVLYLLDGLIFFMVQDWLSVGFHGFALFCIFGGYSSMKKLSEMEEQAYTPLG